MTRRTIAAVLLLIAAITAWAATMLGKRVTEQTGVYLEPMEYLIVLMSIVTAGLLVTGVMLSGVSELWLRIGVAVIAIVPPAILAVARAITDGGPNIGGGAAQIVGDFLMRVLSVVAVLAAIALVAVDWVRRRRYPSAS